MTAGGKRLLFVSALAGSGRCQLDLELGGPCLWWKMGDIPARLEGETAFTGSISPFPGNQS